MMIRLYTLQSFYPCQTQLSDILHSKRFTLPVPTTAPESDLSEPTSGGSGLQGTGKPLAKWYKASDFLYCNVRRFTRQFILLPLKVPFQSRCQTGVVFAEPKKHLLGDISRKKLLCIILFLFATSKIFTQEFSKTNLLEQKISRYSQIMRDFSPKKPSMEARVYKPPQKIESTEHEFNFFVLENIHTSLFQNLYEIYENSARMVYFFSKWLQNNKNPDLDTLKKKKQSLKLFCKNMKESLVLTEEKMSVLFAQIRKIQHETEALSLFLNQNQELPMTIEIESFLDYQRNTNRLLQDMSAQTATLLTFHSDEIQSILFQIESFQDFVWQKSDRNIHLAESESLLQKTADFLIQSDQSFKNLKKFFIWAEKQIILKKQNISAPRFFTRLPKNDKVKKRITEFHRAVYTQIKNLDQEESIRQALFAQNLERCMKLQNTEIKIPVSRHLFTQTTLQEPNKNQNEIPDWI